MHRYAKNRKATLRNTFKVHLMNFGMKNRTMDDNICQWKYSFQFEVKGQTMIASVLRSLTSAILGL